MSKLLNNTTRLQSILTAINDLPEATEGVELPTLSNEAAAEEIFLDKQVIDGQGNIKIGTFTIEEELNEQDDLLTQITAALEGKTSGSGEQATPIIGVNSSGLITATAGTKSSTYQLAFQPAKTITPSTTSQVAVSSGHYTGGDITVAAVPTQTKSVTPKATAQNITPDSGKFLSKVTVNGDSNLVAGNIKSGVSIFGVSGTLEEGSSETIIDEVYKSIIERTITEIEDNDIKTIGEYAFNRCNSLTSVNFHACTSIGGNAFYYCDSLTSVNFPACTRIGVNAFHGCAILTSVNFPACTSIGMYAFGHCYGLASVNFPACTSIGSSAFYYCWKLSSLTLGASRVCTLSNSSAFTSTPFAGNSSYFSGTPHIYVPASLIDAYKSATNWVYFSSYFSTIESLGTN